MSHSSMHALPRPTVYLALAMTVAGGLQTPSLAGDRPGGVAGSATASTPSTTLRAYPEATDLVVVGRDPIGRPLRLTPAAAAAWCAMQRSARTEGVTLLLLSAFRSTEHQRRIFDRKLRAGQTLADILAVNVPPGFSEHHTGSAVDLGTPGNTALVADFDLTAAFRWLLTRAGRFGFSLSYPKGNPAGLDDEPWHWRFDRATGGISQ